MRNLSRFIKPILLGSLMAMESGTAEAQNIDMSTHMHQHMAGGPKSIYLVMMDTMMVQMDEVTKCQSTDEEFMLKMIPHHRGAVNMARYEITHGKSFAMIQLAKSILAEQSSEMAQMELWLNRHPAIGNLLPLAAVNGFEQSMETMMARMPPSEKLTDPDYAFAAVMLPHHQAAVDMAKIILTHGGDLQALAFAKSLISNEQIEIEQMSTYLNKTL